MDSVASSKRGVVLFIVVRPRLFLIVSGVLITLSGGCSLVNSFCLRRELYCVNSPYWLLVVHTTICLYIGGISPIMVITLTGELYRSFRCSPRQTLKF